MRLSGLRGIAAMGLRNLGRHRIKTVITSLAVAISVMLYIVADGWILGMNLDSRRNIVAFEMGAAKVQADAYFELKDELPMYESFAGWEAMRESLADAGYAAVPRFAFPGTLHSRSGSAPIVFNAVDPEIEGEVLRYASYLAAGRFPAPGKFEIAIGLLAAEKLRVGIPTRPSPEEFEEDILGAAADEEEAAFVRSLYGPAGARKKQDFFSFEDEATAALEARKLALREDATKEDIARLWRILSASGRMDVRVSTVIDYKDEDGSGTIRHVNQLIDAVVVGVVDSPNPKTNGNVAFMPIDALQDESGMMLEGRVSELLVRRAGASDSSLPGKDESAAAISAVLEEAGLLPEGISVRSWIEYAGDYIAAARGDDVSTRLMLVFLFLLSFIGIANTMLMSILERTKETGMLRALGMTDGEVTLAYVIEAGSIGLIGSAVGVILGCLINIPMVAYGIDYTEMMKEIGGNYGYRVTGLFKSAWNPPVIALSGAVATLIAAAAALLPTRRALRMPVTESLRFE